MGILSTGKFDLTDFKPLNVRYIEHPIENRGQYGRGPAFMSAGGPACLFEGEAGGGLRTGGLVKGIRVSVPANAGWAAIAG